MAGVLVGGSVLSSLLNVLFDRLASHEVLDFFNARKLNDRLLMKLKITMISVNGLLEDAEEKQTTKLPVKEWVAELKDAFFEADDLLDEIAYESLRSKVESGSQSSAITTQVWNFFPFRDSFGKDMETNLEKIIGRLEHLAKQKDVIGLNLAEGIGEKSLSRRIPTTSIVDEHGFYGRDADKNTLIELLLSDDLNGNDLGVVPVVGMGGIGKTTLAQHVYNDTRVQDWFDLKAWVFVSEDFDVFKITKDIFEEVSSKIPKANSLNKLQVELKIRLKGKRILLVLDDVWSNKYEDWDILRRPLEAGLRGSKILITTRNQSVASVMCTVPPHHLKELTDDDCLVLFKKHAFRDGITGSHSDLEDIGKKIARKCKGLPLAAKALGGVLRFRGNAKEWKKVLESSIWDVTIDNILPALRLSYHYLPSHLKPCFAYCALLPKDYQIRKEKLICLWMAEGLLEQPKGCKDMIEVGEEYFDELLSRSFFQKSKRIPTQFVMHDLTNDLAKFVSGEFCIRLDDSTSKVTTRTRHVSYLRTGFDALKRFEDIYEVKMLRSFLPVSLLHYWVHEDVDSKVLHDLLPRLTRLRVLSLSHYDNVVTLPNSIGKLKHLRYLSFAGTSIKRLPESVTSLYNLQTLILKKCKNLVELPTDMVKLVNLCHLDFTDTNLKEMPPKIGKLTRLRKLSDFFLGNLCGSSITELGELQLLKGKLSLWNLQHVMDAGEALQSNMKNKEHLQGLQFRWDGDTGNSFHERNVLEQLHPHNNIESLLIVGYGGTRFPDWVGSSLFSNVTSVELGRCKFCSFLPPLGQLVSLKILKIKEFDAVETVGLEFYGNCTAMQKPFGALETLRFEKMLQWREWNSYGVEAFPLLRKLSIRNCPNLVNTLSHSLPSLSILEIEGCHQLQASVPVAPAILSFSLTDETRNFWFRKLSSGSRRLKAERFHLYPLDSVLEQMGGLSAILDEIEILNCHSFKCFPLELFPMLKTLSICGCPNIASLSTSKGPLKNFTCLNSLVISNCPSLVSFPVGGLAAPNLTKLEFRDCSSLKSLPEHMHSLLPSLLDMRLSHCPELVSFPEGGLPLKLQILWIHHCNKIIAGRAEWGLQRLPSLSVFVFGTIEDVPAFPEEKLLPSSLTSLTISSYKNLKSLDNEGLFSLMSLRELIIKNCPNLTELPGSIHFLHSLVKLVIFNCQELESLPAGGMPSKLESILIQRCRKLIAARLHWGLHKIPSLLKLNIGKDKDVESFPEEMLLPSTLTSLKLIEFQNLKSLNYKGLQQLSSLRKLKIRKCPNVESLPSEGLPSSLTSLIITGSSMLKRRCQRENGEDWPKISHIPSIELDGVFISNMTE
ncbi:putative disease resistance RPP13-like protein 1 [Mercurialis annua]|uniref:putative disease resistance RPP13-like protein 1 n=1 Tax=Mercurialis annua TaxID=3986 RepID=UPI002160790C|nr:putative disease resistance RPP13-like protein 1 [Mercurialis annua]XP_055960898.1 putative disease resistance RPP13-like protein 1 [Mercurialis annua]XP_055960899.1 putative disease resistance RPP13-like protein 1 [Mercurialis annua]